MYSCATGLSPPRDTQFDQWSGLYGQVGHGCKQFDPKLTEPLILLKHSDLGILAAIVGARTAQDARKMMRRIRGTSAYLRVLMILRVP